MDKRTQTGIVACASIDDYLNNVIKKHENTRADKEVDRITHVDTLSAQTGPIFLAYRADSVINDAVKKTKENKALYDFISPDGIRHQVWKMTDITLVENVRKAFEGIDSVYIADGHHRAASAVKVGLKRRRENPGYTGNEEFNYFLSVLFPDEELMILPYNRVVKDLNGYTQEEFLNKIKEKDQLAYDNLVKKINLKDEKADLQADSKVTADAYISSAYADKFSLQPGDMITLKEKYEKDKYTFRVKGIYEYNGGLCIFMNQNQLNRIFDLGSDYYSGYFSDTEITDISSKYIGSVIDLDALTKISRQLDVSMGNMMGLINGFAIAIFLVLIYLLSKIIIEKNAQSISMVKILGYSNGEISRLYILSTSLVVVLCLLLSFPVETILMKGIFREMMLQSLSGWIALYIDPKIYVKMFVIGLVTYAVVALLEYRKIQKVPMDEALKNVE